MKRQHFQRSNGIVSVCGSITIRGFVDQVIAKHEAFGEEAQRVEDEGLAHSHYQHADHYKRTLKGEK